MSASFDDLLNACIKKAREAEVDALNLGAPAQKDADTIFQAHFRLAEGRQLLEDVRARRAHC